MIFLVIILLLTSVYFSARFFLLSRNIRDVKEDLIEISENIEQNRRLKLPSPNKDMEKLIFEMNNFINKSQKEKIKSIKKEKEIRKEIENISHDLRTPLTSILGYLEFIKEEDITIDERKEYISIIEKKSRNLENLIQSFYDLSRLEADEYKLDIKTIDINKLLTEQLLLFYNDFEKNKISVKFNSEHQKINIKADCNAMERVFTNLIQNAIKYAQSQFEISLTKENNLVVISFKNDTENISEEEIDKLFERFYMKDKSRHQRSSGLGLTITRLLVENMGGQIKAEIEDNYIYFKIYFLQI